MIPMRITWLKRLLLLTLVALAPTVSVATQSMPEYRAKLGFLFNFISFTQWPAGSGDIRVCLHGSNPFDGHLSLLNNKTVHGRALQVAVTKDVAALTDCQVVFIGRKHRLDIPAIAGYARGRELLTVAESKGAIAAGAMIELRQSGGKLTFAVNLAEMRQGPLKLSSKVLALAEEIAQ